MPNKAIRAEPPIVANFSHRFKVSLSMKSAANSTGGQVIADVKLYFLTSFIPDIFSECFL
jgi:hypothetical protein